MCFGNKNINNIDLYYQLPMNFLLVQIQNARVL